MNLNDVVDMILRSRRDIPPDRSLLAAISGIDGCGKGYLTANLHDRLAGPLKVAAVGIDGWLNLPGKRFDPQNLAEHFYRNGLRLDDMFEQFALPLKARRSCHIEMDFAEETATAYRKQRYDFDDIDVVLLEGVYLLKRQYRPHFDLAFWIDCTFETALERALARGQEHLARAETIRAYQTIYFPAQKIHFERDEPRASASAVVVNDPRLEPSGG